MITVTHLTKRFGRVTAVDDASFSALPGRVTGLLGPNGSGKTTTLRTLVGLVRPTSGSVTIAGRPYASLPNPGRNVGTMLDADALHAGRTGREELRLAAGILGLPASRVDDVLEIVGLTPAEAKRRTRTYSLGMRQRLGLGLALLGDPEVVVLDEPANGLDPMGIRWMRTLLRDFASEGRTVLLSSHLLTEMQTVCDDVVVVGHGRVLAQGTTASFVESDGNLEEAFVRLTAGTDRERIQQ
ncbi:ATP-binding cassette domain-containing protein [Sanguibacter massiliensis]|uniref:ATP-binding cassette domain-containing protein n=1 Tax=Sanguibacter massiliensis TaxID=1973217 RepID=UPI000C816531